MNSHGRGVKWERGKFPGGPFEVAERRPKIAHGETVGINAQTKKAPDGAKEISVGRLTATRPCRAVEKRQRAAAVQDAGAYQWRLDRGSVLDCASPLAPWISLGKPIHGFTAGYLLPRLRHCGRPVLQPTRTEGKCSSRSAARWVGNGIRGGS